MDVQLLQIAQQAYDRGEWVKAYQAFWRLERTEESLAFIYFYLGRTAYEMGDYELAKSHYERLLELEPDHPTAHYELARTHLRFARRHENEARDLFSRIPKRQLPPEARRVVSDFAGFSRLPHGHSIQGELEAVGFIDNTAPLLPRLIDNRYGLLDPQSSSRDTESTRGNALTLGLHHTYRQVDDCGFRWQNRLEGGRIHYPGVSDARIWRYHASTALSFRVDERFWFTPQYFREGASFAGGLIEYDREGWAFEFHGYPREDLKTWARFSWHKEYYDENNETKNRGLGVRAGAERHYGPHRLFVEAGLDVTTKEEDENDQQLGLYNQSSLTLRWAHGFTPVATGIIEGELYHLEWKDTEQSRQDTLGVLGVGLQMQVHESWRLDYGVKLARNEADSGGESYTKSLVRVGARYLF